eukprot:5283-Heterococcus_DN1.PRE.5
MRNPASKVTCSLADHDQSTVVSLFVSQGRSNPPPLSSGSEHAELLFIFKCKKPPEPTVETTSLQCANGLDRCVRDIPAGIAHEQFDMAAFGTAFNVGVGSAVTASLTNAEVDALNPAHVSALNAALKDETAALKKFIAAEDADAVYKATHGLGTDEARLVRAA